MENIIYKAGIMEIISTLKVDKIDLKNNNDSEKSLQRYKDEAAMKLGLEIIKKFPYVKNLEQSYDGDLPEMSLNRDHKYIDVYECKLDVTVLNEDKIL